MMDYKEAYYSLIERLKKAKEDNALCDERYCCVIDGLIKEPEENEDNWIRKAILEHIQLCTESIPDRDKFIAWLEKQGTPAKLSKEEQNRFAKGVLSSCALSFIDYLETHKYEGKMCVSNGECEDIENAFQNAMWDRLHRYYCKYIERQGNKTQGKSALEVAKEEKVDNANKVEQKTFLQKCFNAEYERGKNDAVVWSEEDEEMLESITKEIKANQQESEDFIGNYESDVYNGMIDWLQSLKNRIVPQQKEWSKEDEQIALSIEQVMNCAALLNIVPEKISKIRTWLQSLKQRATWKPTEEQIQALNEAVGIV